MKRLGMMAVLLGSAFAFSQPTFAQDRDDYRWRDRDNRHEWREHERREHREHEWREHARHEWREHERREQDGRYRNSYANPNYGNGFYDQYGVWRPY